MISVQDHRREIVQVKHGVGIFGRSGRGACSIDFFWPEQDRPEVVGAGEQRHGGLDVGRDLQVRPQPAAVHAQGQAVGQGPALLQGHQDLGAGPAQDGHARPIGRQPGDHGPALGQSRRQHHDRHGRVRPPRRGHRDQSQRPGPGLRVHGRLH